MNRRPQKSRSSYDAFNPAHTARFKAASPDSTFFERRRQRSPVFLVLRIIAATLLLLLCVNAIANLFVLLRRVEIPVTGLADDFDGYRILHISDLKGASFGSNQSRLIASIKDEDVDLIALTGDMVSPLGDAQPLYALLDALNTQLPGVPVYFIAGDSDPTPQSMEYAPGGSPYAPWVLGAQQRGAILLNAPKRITRRGQTLWLSTPSQLTLDLDTMQQLYEQRYLRALNTNDANEIELATGDLSALHEIRTARENMAEGDILLALTHVPPDETELYSAGESLIRQIDLLLCGHYLGGLLRLPFLGPVFIPSESLPLYGLFPGAQTYTGLSRIGKLWLYANPGLGSSDPLYPPFFFRLFNPPSVTLITLTPSSI